MDAIASEAEPWLQLALLVSGDETPSFAARLAGSQPEHMDARFPELRIVPAERTSPDTAN